MWQGACSQFTSSLKENGGNGYELWYRREELLHVVALCLINSRQALAYFYKFRRIYELFMEPLLFESSGDSKNFYKYGQKFIGLLTEKS